MKYSPYLLLIQGAFTLLRIARIPRRLFITSWLIGLELFAQSYLHFTRQPLPKGYILEGRYKIEKVLGEGGFGITYLVQDTHSGVCYALKEYYPIEAYRYGEDIIGYDAPTVLRQFLREVGAYLKLKDHPNIVQLRDFFRANNTFYLVLEYIRGKSLLNLVKEKGKLEAKECLRYMLDISKALVFLHKNGIVHRDVNPSNIIITPEGKAVLIDFGAACAYRGEIRDPTAVVTDGYSPPEQYTSKSEYDPRMDIYSLGATFYYALTGRAPPSSLKRYWSYERTGRDILVPLSEERTDISECLAEIVQTCLSLEPQNRYANMSQLLESVDDCEESIKGIRKYLPYIGGFGIFTMLLLLFSGRSSQGKSNR